MRVQGQNLSRWLAPLALVACALAVVIILGGGGSGGGSGSTDDSTSARQSITTKSSQKKSAAKKKKKSRTYIVKAGDTLSGIAEKTGVPLSELQAMNPKLDSESLQTGQKVKIGP
jgi:LysM repeat protein